MTCLEGQRDRSDGICRNPNACNPEATSATARHYTAAGKLVGTPPAVGNSGVCPTTRSACRAATASARAARCRARRARSPVTATARRACLTQNGVLHCGRRLRDSGQLVRTAHARAACVFTSGSRSSAPAAARQRPRAPSRARAARRTATAATWTATSSMERAVRAVYDRPDRLHLLYADSQKRTPL